MLLMKSRPPALVINLVERPLRTHVERLEARRLLSSTLTIEGTSAADLIEIKEEFGIIYVSVNNEVRPHTASMFDRVVIDGLDGDDRIIASSDFSKPVKFDGGAGNDSMFGGAGDDELIGGMGNDYLDARAGDDYLDMSRGSDAGQGGIGSDHALGGFEGELAGFRGSGVEVIDGYYIAHLNRVNNGKNFFGFNAEIVTEDGKQKLVYSGWVGSSSIQVTLGDGSYREPDGRIVFSIDYSHRRNGGFFADMKRYEENWDLPAGFNGGVVFSLSRTVWDWADWITPEMRDQPLLPLDPDGPPMHIYETLSVSEHIVRLGESPEPEIASTFSRINFVRPEMINVFNSKAIRNGFALDGESDESRSIV